MTTQVGAPAGHRGPRRVAAALKVRKGDEVQVIAGKDRGKRGRVIEVHPAEERVVVEGLNIVKRHRRANPAKRDQGGIIEKPEPLHVSKVMVVCPRCGRATRVGQRLEEDVKERVCRRCGEAIVVTEKE